MPDLIGHLNTKQLWRHPFGGVSFFVLVSVKLAFGKPLSTVLFVRWALFRFAVLRGALFDPPRYTKTLHATHSIDSCA